ncbi:SMEK domain-containing protein [Mucilaginibacter lappiensis]|uniref:SMEK domain-containing protein n=1 Tax=Mucilaginibacter lappiensis TaxID=354630 RepID=A0A841JJL9_9SPHI|nr:hypothetical protein [Mucilaginibacter lappiensis]
MPFGRIFTKFAGKNFHNINEDVANFSTIYLIDEPNRSILQVSAQQKNSKPRKIKRSLNLAREFRRTGIMLKNMAITISL